MKQIYYLIFLTVLLFIGCTKTDSGLPPNPGSIGGAVGRATSAVDQSFSEPFDTVKVDPMTIVFKPSQANASKIEETVLRVAVSGYDYVWKTGYIYKNNSWIKFEFKETPNENSKWISSKATVEFNSLIPAEFNSKDENAVIVYACKYDSKTSNWDCNENKWLLKVFNVTKSHACNSAEIGCIDNKTLSVCENIGGLRLWQAKSVCGINEYCVSGSCVLESANTAEQKTEPKIEVNKSCEDSDSGLDYFVKGEVRFTLGVLNVSGETSLPDSCLDKTILLEQYCENNVPLVKNYACEDSCLEGVCVKKEEVVEPVSEKIEAVPTCEGNGGECSDSPCDLTVSTNIEPPNCKDKLDSENKLILQYCCKSV